MDAAALLRFGATDGFLIEAMVGLVRTYVSDYRMYRAELGLQTFEEDEFRGLLDAFGFKATKIPRNLGHNRHRWAFSATPK